MLALAIAMGTVVWAMITARSRRRPTRRRRLKIGGKARYALVHIPAHWSGQTPVPLIRRSTRNCIPGLQQRSTDGFVALSASAFIVVYPQAGGEVGPVWGPAWGAERHGRASVRHCAPRHDRASRARRCCAVSYSATGLRTGAASIDPSAGAISPIASPRWRRSPRSSQADVHTRRDRSRAVVPRRRGPSTPVRRCCTLGRAAVRGVGCRLGEAQRLCSKT